MPSQLILPGQRKAKIRYSDFPELIGGSNKCVIIPVDNQLGTGRPSYGPVPFTVSVVVLLFDPASEAPGPRVRCPAGVS